MRPLLTRLLVLTMFLLVSSGAHAQTPTLARSHGWAGVSSAKDTADDYIFNLDANGPGVVTTGSLIILKLSNPTAYTPTITDEKGNIWNTAVTCAGARRYTIYYAMNAIAGTSQIKVHFGALVSDIQASVAVFYNVATSSIIDGTPICTLAIPANNGSPNIQSGAVVTTSNGDLFYNAIFDDVTPIDSNHAISSVTWGAGFSGLEVTTNYGGHASQYAIQSAAGSINPGITFSQSTHDFFASLTVAFKPGTGGSAPPSGIRIVHDQSVYIQVAPGTTFTTNLPFSGNLIFACDEAGTNGTGLNSITDSNGNAYTAIPVTSQGYPQCFHADSATTTPAMTATMHMGGGAGDDIITFYDVTGAAASPLDTAATAANSSTLTATGSGATKNGGNQSSLTLTDAPSIKPSTADGLVIAAMNQGKGPATGCVSGFCTYAFPGATWESGANGGDNNGFTNGDGGAYFYNSAANSTVEFEYPEERMNTNYFQALAVAFKAGPVSSKPAPPTNLVVTGIQ